MIAPASKLDTARRLTPETTTSSLGILLDLGPVRGNELLDLLDWLLGRQRWIQRGLARRHLRDATLILYHFTSSYLEGQRCPLADFGHSRDGKKGKKQIVFGLLCASDGCPIAVELFSGSTGDPTTLGPQVARIRDRLGLRHVALVGDRGMITTARIRHDLEPAGLDWISALKAVDLRKLARMSPSKPGDKKPPQPALAPETPIPDAVAEIRSPDFPGEWLMICLNPRLREERRRKREELLAATEETLERTIASVRAGNLSGKAEIGRRVGRETNRRKVETHFEITIDDESMSWARRQEKIAAEARIDGIYVVRTSLEEIEPEAAVSA